MAAKAVATTAVVMIDGSAGEGGGQVIRTALALSAITGTPLQLLNIRKRRSNPGLQEQHLNCVLAAQKLCNAAVKGADLKSTELLFSPSSCTAVPDMKIKLAGAGSASLILQTVLPIALFGCTEPSRFVISGGTHAGLSPTGHFMEQTFFPALGTMGFGHEQLKFELVKCGFFPRGGGELRLSVTPSSGPLAFFDMTAPRPPIASHSLAVIHTKDSQYFAGEIAAALAPSFPSVKPEVRLQREAVGQGTCIIQTVDFPDARRMILSSTIPKAKPAALVADAKKQADAFLSSSYFVDEFLCDQLLLPLALGAGGAFCTGVMSQHTLTNITIIEKFLGKCVEVAEVQSQVQIPVAELVNELAASDMKVLPTPKNADALFGYIVNVKGRVRQ